mmetsp:Transcript_6912/g.11518  ORF Transcript_6912/g.11518 Transcript_6912/m.11518 type:complete len:261 (-) Transcript_6912:960-1742(-)
MQVRVVVAYFLLPPAIPPALPLFPLLALAAASSALRLAPVLVVLDELATTEKKLSMRFWGFWFCASFRRLMAPATRSALKPMRSTRKANSAGSSGLSHLSSTSSAGVTSHCRNSLRACWYSGGMTSYSPSFSSSCFVSFVSLVFFVVVVLVSSSCSPVATTVTSSPLLAVVTSAASPPTTGAAAVAISGLETAAAAAAAAGVSSSTVSSLMSASLDSMFSLPMSADSFVSSSGMLNGSLSHPSFASFSAFSSSSSSSLGE